jgi:hypothetical protein
MKSIFKNYQYDMSFRSLNDISDEELKDICLLSGEVSNNFTIEKTERHCDEDENCRYITVDCKSVHQDNSYSLVQICVNDIFVVWVVNLKRKGCDNICRRDVICKQYEVMLYLILKGFSFNSEFDSVNLFMSNREKWLNRSFLQ